MVFEITFNRRDFEEILLTDGQDKIFLNRKNKPYFYLTLATVLLTFISLAYSINSNSRYELFIILLFASLFQLVRLYLKAKPFIKRKKLVAEYMDSQLAFKKHRIEVSELTFSVFQDQTFLIAEWAEFKSGIVTDDFISLTTTRNYLIPRKAMLPADFEALKTFVSKKLRLFGS